MLTLPFIFRVLEVCQTSQADFLLHPVLSHTVFIDKVAVCEHLSAATEASPWKQLTVHRHSCFCTTELWTVATGNTWYAAVAGSLKRLYCRSRIVSHTLTSCGQISDSYGTTCHGTVLRRRPSPVMYLLASLLFGYAIAACPYSCCT